jgi:hypothetical protein
MQGLTASLSTFSGHLARIAAARKESGSHALMLLDELGTGTDPEEGSALAAALLTRLVRSGTAQAGGHAGACVQTCWLAGMLTRACTQRRHARSTAATS